MFTTPKSLSLTAQLPDAGADYRSARRIGQFRLSAHAAYFPAFPGTRYVPYEAVSVAWVKQTALPLTGCCGKELPMYRLRLRYDGGKFYQDFLFESEKQARQALDLVLAHHPDISQEEAV